MSNKFKIFYKSNGALNISRVQKEWCIKNGVLELYTEIMQITNFLPTTAHITERMYCIEHNIIEPVLCAYCKQIHVKYSNENKKYQQCCSRTCKTKLQQAQCGYINAFTSDDFLEKSKATKLQKYGDINYQNYDKRIATNISRYGVSNVSQCEVVKSKKAAKNTPQVRALTQQKREQTNISKYGVRSYAQSEQFIQKRFNWKLYCFKTGEVLKLLGYEPYAAQILEDNEITYEDIVTNLKVSYVLNGTSRVYTPDFYISKLNCCIEVKSVYTITSDNLMNVEKWNATINNGYRLFVWVIYPNKQSIIAFNWTQGETIDNVLRVSAIPFKDVYIN